MEGDNDDNIKSSLNAFFYEENIVNRRFSKIDKIKLIVMSLLIAILLIIITVILVLLLKSSSSESKNRIGEIICLYNIESSSQETLILSKEFNNPSDLDIFIDEEKIKYNIYQKLNAGEHIIKFIFYNDIDMNNMFKDVNSLVNANITSINNGKIIGMEKIFENCQNLGFVNIDGFNLKEIKSFHKLFYNSCLTKFKISGDISSVEDISFMLAGTSIEYINLKDILHTNILKIYLICLIIANPLLL